MYTDYVLSMAVPNVEDWGRGSFSNARGMRDVHLHRPVLYLEFRLHVAVFSESITDVVP